MIKFFRKIRQKLLSDNKFSKYLIYAIGEIILVVIGILIALGVNQRSQTKANEAKIEAIFEVILQDLTADIKESNQILQTIQVVNSIANNILSDSTKKDSYQLYTDNDAYKIVDILNYSNLFNFTDGGYQNLSQNLDILPQKYNTVLTGLNQQYNAYKESVEYWDNRVNLLTIKNEEFINDNFPWAYNPSQWKYHLDEVLTHPKYKNLLHKFKTINIAWLNSVTRYRTLCTDNYQHIARLLNKPIKHESFKIDETISSLFVGEWKPENNTDKRPNFNYFLDSGRLFFQEKDNVESKAEIFVSALTLNDSIKQVNSIIENYLTLHEFKNGTMILRYNREYDNSFKEIKYIKVN